MLPQAVSVLAGRIERLLLPSASVVAIASGLATLLLGAWVVIAAPTDVRGVECNVLFTLQKYAISGTLYTNPSDLPYDVAQYTPFYYVVCGGGLAVLGIDALDPLSVSMVARGVSFGCSILVAIIVYMTQIAIMGVPQAYAATSTSFAFAVCSPWLFLARPDALLALMLVASVAALLMAPRTGGIASVACLVLSAVLAIGAMAAKQNGLVVPIILMISLLLSWRIRDLAIVSLALAAIGGIIAVHSLTTWPHLIDNVFGGINNGIDFDNAFRKTYATAFGDFAPVFSIGFVALLAWAKRLGEDRRLEHAAFLSAVPLTFVGAILSGIKAGSSEVYFNESIIFSCIIAAAWASSKSRESVSAEARHRGGDLSRLMAFFILLFLPYWTVVQFAKIYTSVSKETFRSEELSSVALFIRDNADNDSLVLSWPLAINNFLPDYCIAPQKEVIAYMKKSDSVSLDNLRTAIEGGRVKYGIISTEDRPSEIFGISLPPSAVVHESEKYAIVAYQY